MDIKTWVEQSGIRIESEDVEKIIVHCPRPGHGGHDITASAAIYPDNTWFSCLKCGDIPLSQLADELGVEPLPYDKKVSTAIARYDFYENGVLLYYKEKYENKKFLFFKPDGTVSVKGVKRVLYRVDQLRVALKHGKTVYITEGEKDAESLNKLGFISTSSDAGSAKPWGDDYLSEFPPGANIIICPDFDDPGIKFAQANASALIARGCKVTWLDLGYEITPNHGKDVSDYLIDHKTLPAPTPTFREPEPNFKLKKLSEFSLSPPDWLVHNLIETDSLGTVYGPSGAGKSFFTLDLSLCIAAGVHFHGRKTKKTPCVYLAGEGHRGIVKRTWAWCLHNKIDIDNQEWWLADRSFDMMSDISVGEVLESIEHYTKGKPPGIVVIDTLARNFGDGDENSTKDMNRVIKSADAIRNKYKCLVLIVHHTGHNAERARGNSARFGAMDYEYKLIQETSTITVSCEKMKDGSKPNPFAFELLDVPLGIEYEGDMMTSAVLNPVDTPEQKESKLKVSGHKATALNCLKNLWEKQKKTLLDGGINSDPMVLFSDWRQAMADSGLDRYAISKSKNKLEEDDEIVINMPYVMLGGVIKIEL